MQNKKFIKQINIDSTKKRDITNIDLKEYE